MFCKKCGNELPEKAKYCNKCGTAIFTREVQKNNIKYKNLIECKSCGAMVAKTAKSCPKCGAKTPGQLAGETIQGIGCGLLSVPLIIGLIIFYIIIWNLIK